MGPQISVPGERLELSRGCPHQILSLRESINHNMRQHLAIRISMTYGRRLRAVGVPLETRKVLFGHKDGDITTHYSAPELRELIDAVERLAEKNARKCPNFTLLHVREKGVST